MSKILILDDDLNFLTIVKSLLNEKGFEVTAFTDWKKAWDSIKTYKPHLILLDVFLKGIDGLDICRKLKTFYSTRNIPVLVFSSFPNIAETAIFEYGADDFIQKPFEVNILIKKMNSILSRKKHAYTVKNEVLLRNFLQK
jgi:two-component system, OmpR family, response regulator RstA